MTSCIRILDTLAHSHSFPSQQWTLYASAPVTEIGVEALESSTKPLKDQSYQFSHFSIYFYIYAFALLVVLSSSSSYLFILIAFRQCEQIPKKPSIETLFIKNIAFIES